MPDRLWSLLCLLPTVFSAASSSVPVSCQWSDWTAPPAGQHCRWKNEPVSLEYDGRGSVTQQVTFCARVKRQRHRTCDSDSTSTEYDTIPLIAFRPNPDGPAGEDPRMERQNGDDCISEKCPQLDGGWCYWTTRVECQHACRQATSPNDSSGVYIERHRVCNCPKPRNAGQNCQGPKRERQRCECVSLAASFTSFLRTTEGILIATGVCVVLLLLIACCLARVCCDTDDGTEDFKIGSGGSGGSQFMHRQQQQQQQSGEQHQRQHSLHQKPLLVSLDDCAGFGGEDAASLAGRPSAPSESTTATTSEEAVSMVVRLPVSAGSIRQPQQQLQQPPPLPPKRYKQRQQQQQQQQQKPPLTPPRVSRRQLSYDANPGQLKYTPPFPNEV